MVVRITLLQMLIFITIMWIIVRASVAVIKKRFSIKHELKMLLVYICIS